MGARFLIQLLSLARLHFASRKQGAGKPVIRTMNEKINPFSFFGSIYLNPVLHSPAERDSIIEHEKVHISEWHTIDVLAGELNRIFYWFNPGAWLIMNAVRENLEFMADRKVLQSGADVKTYQYNLIKVSKNPYVSSLANNFNFAHLKIRVTMMNKKPSSELHLVKYLVLVPFLALISLAFNISDRPAKEAPPRMNDEQLVSPLDTLPADSEVVAWGYFLRGDTSGFFSTPPSKSEGWKKALFIVDRKEWKFADVMKLAPNDILSLSIIKDAQALYGEKGKSGVIIINTKNRTDKKEIDTTAKVDVFTGEKVKKHPRVVSFTGEADSIKSDQNVSVQKVIILEKGKRFQISLNSSKPGETTIINGDKALILIDGKESDYETMQQLTEDDIDARTIISGKSGAKLYGSKAEYVL
ncbi:BlaR1 peptidase M56 [Anseongella ginsenosidimutans]|uniref:BlaR1 peptidase M56 n=2 Tax=Anseongella ginsenosidimutans TaxID=496056 RepID=A0A4R3KSR1_9SPHI|nr:BlaR1 peptidase M56 [Anseongella ginsenosidimutans]